MTEFRIKHVRHSNHVSQLATGLIVTSSASDDMIPLVFFRDSIQVQDEIFEIIETSKSVDGVEKHALKPSGEVATVDRLREDVATILIPRNRIANIVGILQRFATAEAAKKAEPSVADQPVSE